MTTKSIELRDHGIYCLEEGRRLVVRSAHQGTYWLYDTRFGIAHPPVYSVNIRGEILAWGALTGWRIENLLDTGETSTPLDLRNLALL